MNFDLVEKKVLVTGASGEIGASIARAFHAKGCTLTVSGTRRDRLESLATELGSRCHIVSCDLQNEKMIEELPKETLSIMGHIDILINNAGITKDGLLMRMSNDDWNSVISINLNASMYLIRSVLRVMLKSRWGRIINIGSVVGTSGNAGQVNYAASKAGLIGMTKSVAQEVATRGVTVNCVSPGFVKSAMTDKLSEEQKDRILSSVPMGRMGNANEIAAAILFLASEEASYITGQTIHVNGGMVMV